jgi:hypothetical protein
MNGRGFLVHKTSNILPAVPGRLRQRLGDNRPFLGRQFPAAAQAINRAGGKLPATGGAYIELFRRDHPLIAVRAINQFFRR